MTFIPKLLAAACLFGALVGIAAQAAQANEPLSFARDVQPVLTKAGCNSGACHGSFQGRGGMKLSLLGFDPLADYSTLIKADRGRRVFPAAPEKSLLLLKATAAIPHGGGRRLVPGSPAYLAVHKYLGQGLAPPQAADPTVVRLEVRPLDLVLAPGEHSDLKVQAHWSDGVSRDVTPWALFDCREKMIVEASPAGRVEAEEPGRAAVTVRFMGQVAAVSVTIPYAKIDDYPAIPQQNFIDELVAADWRRLGVLPAPLASDEEFMRRVSLDLIGTLPTTDEVRTFLTSTAPDKRSMLVDALLERPEYVDYWAIRWGDLLRVHRRYVGVKGLGTFASWIRRAVRENRPIDEMVRELLTAQGSLYSNGPVAFYFVDQKPEDLAETTAQVFLGVRMQCTRCHHHPMEVWSQDDYYSLAAFFTRLEIKDTKDNGRFGGAKVLRPVSHAVKSRQMLVDATPRALGDAERAAESEDVRTHLAASITAKDNPYFARNFANRYWAWLTGRGLVEPVDDLRATNPPSNPALLDALAKEFVDHGYDSRHLIRTICNSHVYQLASEVSPKRDQQGMFFTHRTPRRMSAEVLLDAVNQATGAREDFKGVPAGTRAIALSDPSIPSYFLTTFGRPLRNNPCECARGAAPDLSQALHLMNGAIHEKVIGGPRLSKLLAAHPGDAELADELYLATLSRRPTEDEQAAVHELVAEAPTRSEGWEDVFWTLLNSAEFVFNH